MLSPVLISSYLRSVCHDCVNDCIFTFSNKQNSKMTAQPVVTIAQGQLQGRIVTHCRGGQYFSFQGIPYGKPPVGELRFKAPLPAESWKGIRNATTEGDICFSRHMVFQFITGSEDCLFLNVYTPELPTQNIALKPVMVWLHGGGFFAGSGNEEFYGPDLLVSEDVVLVTINYRLGLLGFLNMNDPSLGVPGNAGLKDQVLALKWVQENIKHFFGDPNNVTIFGESAGGAAAHYIMLSPMAKGLFHRVIVQSGSALCLWARGQPSAPLIAKALQLDTTDEKRVLNILQEMSPEELLEMQEKIPDEFSADHIRPFCPVVENSSVKDAFLHEEPVNLMKTGKFNKVPLMIGYTSREGMLAVLLKKFKQRELEFSKDFQNYIPYNLKIAKETALSKTISQKIKNFYYGDNEPSTDNMDIFYQLNTDNYFLTSIYNTIRSQNATSSSPVYLYRFSVESDINILKKLIRNNNSGVCHGDDLGYLFKTAATPELRPGSLEDNSVRRVTKLWTTFARHGDPNPVKKDPLINVTWKPTQEGQLHFLDIGENLTVGLNPDAGRMAFWDEIYSLSPAASKL